MPKDRSLQPIAAREGREMVSALGPQDMVIIRQPGSPYGRLMMVVDFFKACTEPCMTAVSAAIEAITVLAARVTAIEGRATDFEARPIVTVLSYDVGVTYLAFLAIGVQTRTVNVNGLKVGDRCFLNRTGGAAAVQIIECQCLADNVLTVTVSAFILIGAAGSIPARLTVIR